RQTAVASGFAPIAQSNAEHTDLFALCDDLGFGLRSQLLLVLAVISLDHVHANIIQFLRVTIIEITPVRNGWKVFESPGSETVFLNKEQAIDYAQTRACFRTGEIRILKSNGAVERTIPFSEANRKL